MRKILDYAFIGLLFFSCIDPVSPEFDFKEGLVFIEGFISNKPESSYVNVYISEVEYGIYDNKFINGSTIVFENFETQERVKLIENLDVYVPPQGFKAEIGEKWLLVVELPDGRVYKSLPEQLVGAVKIEKLKSVYDPTLFFSEQLNSYVPGHSVLTTFEDPSNEDNRYLWRFKSFENMDICEQCDESIFRNGGCTPALDGTSIEKYYDYGCDSDCWRIRFPEEIYLFENKFTNGTTVVDLPIANIPLYTKEDILVQIEQYSLTTAAYDYYKILKDIVDNNKGLNSPPPAALVGNISNVNDKSEFVLGNFTAAASTSSSLFIDRSNIAESQIDGNQILNIETCEVCPPQTACPVDCSPVELVPCSETRYRTAILPDGWITDN